LGNEGYTPQKHRKPGIAVLSEILPGAKPWKWALIGALLFALGPILIGLVFQQSVESGHLFCAFVATPASATCFYLWQAHELADEQRKVKAFALRNKPLE
jgi:hypothetical protein